MLIDNTLLDSVTQQACNSGRLRMNLNFHPSPGSKSQRLLNAIEPGSVVPTHRHLHTGETYILLRGKMCVYFYNEAGAITETFDLDPLQGRYGVDIPAGQWHSLTVLAPGTVMFEVKDGPYMPLSTGDMR